MGWGGERKTGNERDEAGKAPERKFAGLELCTVCTLCTDQWVTTRCRLSWLTNSALVYEPKCGGGGGVAGSQPMSTAVVHRSPNKFWRSNSIFNLCTAKIKYRNFETNIIRKGISGSQSQFLHSCVCEWFIYCIPTIGLPIMLEEICRPILGLYKSLTDKHAWMWKLGPRPRYSQKRNT